MKRAWLVLFGVVIIAGGGSAWFLFRDTPKKVLRDGLAKLISVRSVDTMRLDVSWTDPVKRITVGWSALGQADLHDMTHPSFLGGLDVGEGVFDGSETADIVLVGNAFAVRPDIATASFLRRYDQAVNDPSRKTFAQLDRDSLLTSQHLAGLIAGGKNEDVRVALASIAPTIRISGPWEHRSTDPASVVAVPFTLDGPSLRAFLLGLIRVWKNTAPTAENVAWINETSQELGAGSYFLTVDRETRAPIALDASWPRLDQAGKATSHMQAHVEFAGMNAKTQIAMPTQLVDATESMLGIARKSGLPMPGERTGFISPTGTIAVPPRGSGITDDQRFSRYLNELARKKRGGS